MNMSLLKTLLKPLKHYYLIKPYSHIKTQQQAHIKFSHKKEEKIRKRRHIIRQKVNFINSLPPNVPASSLQMKYIHLLSY